MCKIEILELAMPYVQSTFKTLSFTRKVFEEANGRSEYNKRIRQEVDERPGVYIWVDSTTEEIVYIGMAGKIKKDGRFSDHSIRKRLQASREKDKLTGKYVQTNDYLYNEMKERAIEGMDIVVMYTKDGEAPSFLEALMLNHFYKIYKRLPILNNSF